jgi:hypothetical protein
MVLATGFVVATLAALSCPGPASGTARKPADVHNGRFDRGFEEDRSWDVARFVRAGSRN